MTKSSVKSKPKATKAKKEAPSQQDLWTSAIKSSTTNSRSRSYSMSENFIVGDVIEHLSFGKGVVQNVVTKDKIIVIFEDNTRTLVQNK